jgi:ACT domain-containing protein
MNNSRKKQILEQLKKTPIVQITCEKLGVSRATFYRWKKKDKKFSSKVDQALYDGSQLINDMAESQLISAIKNNNLSAIIFWLKNHHKIYSAKLEVTSTNNDIPLTDEQKEIIKRSLSMAFENYTLPKENEKETIK